VWLISKNKLLTRTVPLNALQSVLSFKSECKNNIYRHIVLVVKSGGKYGALGLSRRSDLMSKPLVYGSLLELIQEFKAAYQNNQHRLVKLKIGGRIPHEYQSQDRLPWKVIKLLTSSLFPGKPNVKCGSLSPCRLSL
jgi:hypothetical protein